MDVQFSRHCWLHCNAMCPGRCRMVHLMCLCPQTQNGLLFQWVCERPFFCVCSARMWWGGVDYGSACMRVLVATLQQTVETPIICNPNSSYTGSYNRMAQPTPIWYREDGPRVPLFEWSAAALCNAAKTGGYFSSSKQRSFFSNAAPRTYILACRDHKCACNILRCALSSGAAVEQASLGHFVPAAVTPDSIVVSTLPFRCFPRTQRHPVRPIIHRTPPPGQPPVCCRNRRWCAWNVCAPPVSRCSFGTTATTASHGLHLHLNTGR
jgi:hypothetical protein